MIAALVALMAAASPSCTGIVLHDGRRATCSPLPPLADACRVVRACRARGSCAITVTGRVGRSTFQDEEAWGDWRERLHDASKRSGMSAAAIERLRGKAPASPPYTVFLVAGRPPLLADGLFVDDLGWLDAYAKGGPPPDGLRPAPRDAAQRVCPGQPSRRAASRAK